MEDELRQAECDLRDAEFRASCGLGTEEGISVAREAVERAKREICACLDPNPIAYQRILIIREAERKGFDPDIYAETWICHNSRTFRKLWDEGERSIDTFDSKINKSGG